MRVIKRDFTGITRKDIFTIVPIGDIHIGAIGCNEQLLKKVVKRIQSDPHCYWVGMGDYCDFIRMSDRRFDPAVLADWVEVADLVDLPKRQVERVLSFLNPIADKCLGLIEGNHERTIKQWSERDVFSEIVSGVKAAAKMKTDQQLGFGASGWLRLRFERGSKGVHIYTISLHHGFVGGKLAGAKALNMQRWLWTHRCDLALFGHSHNQMVQVEGVEEIDRNGNIFLHRSVGAYTGTFLQSITEGTTSYAEFGGYFPLPVGGVEIKLQPGSKIREQRLRVVT